MVYGILSTEDVGKFLDRVDQLLDRMVMDLEAHDNPEVMRHKVYASVKKAQVEITDLRENVSQADLDARAGTHHGHHSRHRHHEFYD